MHAWVIAAANVHQKKGRNASNPVQLLLCEFHTRALIVLNFARCLQERVAFAGPDAVDSVEAVRTGSL